MHDDEEIAYDRPGMPAGNKALHPQPGPGGHKVWVPGTGSSSATNVSLNAGAEMYVLLVSCEFSFPEENEPYPYNIISVIGSSFLRISASPRLEDACFV